MSWGPAVRLRVRAAIARELESGDARWAGLGLLSAAWGAASARAVCRPLSVPPGVRAIGVGGATLGGSCKTPFAIALTEALARRGERVALIGHAYRAKPRSARMVLPTDDVYDVGDDALFAARRLAEVGAPVIVAPTRQAAIDWAAREARCLVIDGVLQTRPERLARALLLLDADQPWGNGKCPPAGDLRAPPDALLGVADIAIFVRDALAAPSSPADIVATVDRVVGCDGHPTPVAAFAGTKFGLLLAIARPERVMRALAQRGLHPSVTVTLADHDRPRCRELDRSTKGARIEAWLTTAKCATKLPWKVGGAPVFVLAHELGLPRVLLDWASSDCALPLFLGA
ncbi:MAG TPA: tetraacyldisaccharide 4'-kinase [Polyangiaceae bacterium]